MYSGIRAEDNYASICDCSDVGGRGEGGGGQREVGTQEKWGWGWGWLFFQDAFCIFLCFRHIIKLKRLNRIIATTP